MTDPALGDDSQIPSVLWRNFLLRDEGRFYLCASGGREADTLAPRSYGRG